MYGAKIRNTSSTWWFQRLFRMYLPPKIGERILFVTRIFLKPPSCNWSNLPQTNEFKTSSWLLLLVYMFFSVAKWPPFLLLGKDRKFQRKKIWGSWRGGRCESKMTQVYQGEEWLEAWWGWTEGPFIFFRMSRVSGVEVFQQLWRTSTWWCFLQGCWRKIQMKTDSIDSMWSRLESCIYLIFVHIRQIIYIYTAWNWSDVGGEVERICRWWFQSSLKEHVVPKGGGPNPWCPVTWIYPTPRECNRGFLRVKFGIISEAKKYVSSSWWWRLHLLNGGGNPLHTFNLKTIISWVFWQKKMIESWDYVLKESPFC